MQSSEAVDVLWRLVDAGEWEVAWDICEGEGLDLPIYDAPNYVRWPERTRTGRPRRWWNSLSTSGISKWSRFGRSDYARTGDEYMTW